MGIPAAMTRVALVGHSVGSEIFETGFWCAAVPTDANGSAVAISAAFEQYARQPLTAMIGQDCGYDEVRLLMYLNGGPKASSVASAPIANGHGTSNGNAPLQQCMVCTLTTASAGRSSRGRMYLPANGLNLGPGHLFTNQQTNDALNAVGLFLGSVTHDLALPVVVLSQKLGTHAPITGLHIDQKVDIQRRRANRQPQGQVNSLVMAV